jgi:thiamine-monophosphate kinase
MTSTFHTNLSSDSSVESQTKTNGDEDLGDPDPLGGTISELMLIKDLQQIFKQTEQRVGEVDFTDDCALINRYQPKSKILVTTDALCEGVHFDRDWDTLESIGAQAVVVNLSDLASSGARPIGLLWSLSLPQHFCLEDVHELAKGFKDAAALYETPVIGGNTLVRDGHLEIHVTAIGETDGKVLRRTGAQEGDLVYVTGALGSRSIGYLDPTSAHRQIRHQWRPHLTESKCLVDWGYVTAMMDVSDGLLLDTARLAQCNQLIIDIDSRQLPVDPTLKTHPLISQAILSGGEDYVLLFTAPSGVAPPADANATCIGICHSRQDHHSQSVLLNGSPVAEQGHLYHVRGHQS